MKIAIHHTPGSFSEQWIIYCDEQQIDYKIVDCYDSDIISQLSDCDCLMWHFSQNSPRSFLVAKPLVYSLTVAGKKTFPDFYSSWHFDDKLGQKYLLEAIGAPAVTTWVFYEKEIALRWAQQQVYPIVFKLRGGAGSQNVRLVKSKNHASRLIKKAFGIGFYSFDPSESLREEIRRLKLGKATIKDIAESIVRFFLLPKYARVKGREKGYIYFQEFIPDNDSDFRVIVVGNRAFAIKRLVRENDFRASGSGSILYDRQLFDIDLISQSFSTARRLNVQCVAFDYVYKNSEPLLVEISYGFAQAGYYNCPGYWDEDLNWHEGKFNPYGWMVEDLISGLK